MKRKHHVLSAGLNRGGSEAGRACSGYTLVIQQNLGQIIHVGVCSPENKGTLLFPMKQCFLLTRFSQGPDKMTYVNHMDH